MKNRVISLELCLIVFMCYGCDNQSNKTIYENVCDVALTVDLDLENDKVSFYDLFESVSIIQLETKEDILLHRIDKIVFHNDSIFIMDKKQGGIFLFDSKGKYLNKLSKQGNGPDEYFDLSDFTINRYTNNLELLSTYRGISCYDLNFNFIGKIPFSDKGWLVHRFAIIDSCTRALFNIVRTHNIEIYDISEKKIKGEYIEVPKFIYRNTPLGGPFLLENMQKGEATFTQPFSRIVYSVTPSSLKERYKWDFGKYNFSIEKLNPELSQDEYSKIFAGNSFKRNNVYSFLANAENSWSYLSQFTFGSESHVLTVLYDKTTGKYIKIGDLKEGISFPYYPIVTEECLYTVPRDTFVVNRYLNDKIKKENFISLKQYEEDGNPMILQYRFNKHTE